MNFKAFVEMIWLYWKTFLAFTASVFIAALLWILLVHNQYVSSVQLMVAVNGSTTAEAYENDTLIAGRISSYIALLSTDAISQRVVDKLGLKMSAAQLATKINATNMPPKTSIIDVAVSDDSPDQARRIAQAVGDEFVSYTGALETPTGEGPQKVVTSVVSPATEPHRRWLEKAVLSCLAAVFAVMIGAVAVWVRSATDPVIRIGYRAASVAKAPVFGSLSAPPSALADSLNDYRRFRNRLGAVASGGVPGVVEIVPVDTTKAAVGTVAKVAHGLAQAMTLAGNRPIVVDAVGVAVPQGSARVELTDWRVKPDEVMSDTGYRFVGSLRKDHDAVIIAAPPVLSTLTASAISDYADVVVLLVRLGVTKRTDVMKAAETLKVGGESKIGLVLVRRGV